MTHAPATRRGRPSPRARGAGHGSSAPYGFAGSMAASSGPRPARAAFRRARARRRSTAPGSANCAPASPSTKWPRRTLPASSIARSTVYSGAEAALDALGVDRLAADDAVAIEQQDRARVRALRVRDGRRRAASARATSGRPPARRARAGSSARRVRARAAARRCRS